MSEIEKVNTMLVCLIAPPGAGKTTLARKFCFEAEAYPIGTSSLLETAGYDLGPGKLIPDESVIEVVKPELRKYLNCKEVILLDGCPRTIEQLKFLVYLTTSYGAGLSVVFLETPIEVAIERYRTRIAKTPLEELRADDKGGEEVLKERYEEYHKWTHPIIDYIRKNGSPKLIEVNGSGSPENVLNQMIVKVFIHSRV